MAGCLDWAHGRAQQAFCQDFFFFGLPLISAFRGPLALRGVRARLGSDDDDDDDDGDVVDGDADVVDDDAVDDEGGDGGDDGDWYF